MINPLKFVLKRHRKLAKNQSGMFVVAVIIVAGALVMVGVTILSYSVSQYALTQRNIFNSNALLVAEAGIEQTLHELNIDESFTGFTSEQEFFNSPEQGRGFYTSEIVEATDSNSRYITVIAQVHRFNKPDRVEGTRIIQVTTVGTSSEGYAVHTGPGGLILGGSANITNSDVFVNGTITLNGASKIGTHDQPVNVQVAHQSCPTGNNPGPTFPVVCTTGQPISMAWSTNIYGSVCATNQTSTGPNPSGNIQPGTSGDGLILGCVADPVSPPTYNKTAHVAAVETTANSNNNLYVCNQWPFQRTWPANLRLNGNVNIGSSCDITINGDAYITGDLTIGGAATIRVSDTVGTDRPVVLVDGEINIGGSAQMVANDQGTGIQFVSYQANAACNPNCTSLSGNDLRNSQNVQTVRVGGGVNLPGMIFHAHWGRVTIAGSGSVGAAAGQTVDMSGAGTVVFGTNLSSGETTWTISSYQQRFPN